MRFPYAGTTFCRRIKKKRIKSIVGSPTTKLGIGKLRGTILTSRRSQRHSLALARGAKKGLKQVNGVLLKPRRGAFAKSVRRKLKKKGVFRGQETLFPEVSLPKWRALRPEAKTEGCQGSQIESHEFYPGRGAFYGKIEFKHLELRS